MKTTFGVILVSAMLLASAGAASAASYIQASSTEDQLSTDTKPKAVTMNSTDASKGIKQDKGVVVVNETGTYFIIAAVQVGGKAAGLVRMWLRLNGKDADNSNTEQYIPDPSFTAVLVSQGINELKKGDKIQAVFSGSVPGIGLVYKKPEGEPAVPSMIFSAWKVD